MSTAEILALIEPHVVPPFSALLLYGSYARQEADETSDVDILQLTPVHTAPYSNGRLNFTCYTQEQLITLAMQGTLFARHLVTEAVPILDPSDFLGRLRSAYVAPTNYVSVCTEVKKAVPLVAINEEEFQKHKVQYCSTVSYLLRTYVYAKAFESGAKSFSMRHVAELTGDGRTRQVLSKLRVSKSYYPFRSTTDLLFEITNTHPFIRDNSLEALVVNMFGLCDLAVILGLRILAGGELITYPVLQPQ